MDWSFYRDRVLTEWMRYKWTKFGLDSVSVDTYNFLLSLPDSDSPNKVHKQQTNKQTNKQTTNKVHLLDSDGKVRFTSKHKEDVLRGGLGIN